MLWVARFDGLGRPFDSRVKIARFGIGGGQRAKDVGHFVLGQFAGLRGQRNRPSSVAQLFIGRCGQYPGQVVQDAVLLRFQFERLFVIGDGLGLPAHVQIGVAPSAKGLPHIGLLGKQRGVGFDRLGRLLLGAVKRGQLEQGQRVLRIELVELLQLDDRLVKPLAFGQQQRAGANGDRQIGPQFERPIRIGQGLLVVALLLIETGTHQQHGHIVGAHVQRPVDVLQRSVEIRLASVDAGPLQQRHD